MKRTGILPALTYRSATLVFLLVAFAAIPFARFLHVPVWSAQFVGLLAGLAAVSTVAFFGLVAWPWYALVGSFTVFAAGNAAALLLPVGNQLSEPGGLHTDLPG